MNLKVIVMAGGRGTRFWPQSTVANPKQFSEIISDKPMLKDTIDRLGSIVSKDHIYISTGSVYKDAALKASGLEEKSLILEPSGRDTAAAICLSVLLSGDDPDDVLCFLPADHYIGRLEDYRRDLKQAASYAADHRAIVLLGITPGSPSPNYGYLETQPSAETSYKNFKDVVSFKEKPDVQTAGEYLKKGGYYWNSGMFLFTRDRILKEFKKNAPEVYDKTMTYVEYKDRDYSSAAEIFSQIPKISFDYAIMEKTSHVKCLPASFEWDDVGSWNALERIGETDRYGNYKRGSVHLYNCGNVTAVSDDDRRHIVLSGVENINVIVHKDVVYICEKSKESDIKVILKDMEATNPYLL